MRAAGLLENFSVCIFNNLMIMEAQLFPSVDFCPDIDMRFLWIWISRAPISSRTWMIWLIRYKNMPYCKKKSHNKRFRNNIVYSFRRLLDILCFFFFFLILKFSWQGSFFYSNDYRFSCVFWKNLKLPLMNLLNSHWVQGKYLIF